MKYRFGPMGLALLCLGLVQASLALTPPDPARSFFSPQLSPDHTQVLWESLDRRGSIWLADPDGGNLTFVVRGHSPSWIDARSFRFVQSVDDGHRILEENRYRFDLTCGRATLEEHRAANPDYRTTPVPVTGRPLPGRPLSGTVVCLDPGHGMRTGAPCPTTGTIEDVYILRSAYIVKDYLERSGATVRMTRYDLGTNPALTSRVSFSNSVGAKLFHSIHYNSASNVAARGTETWYRSHDDTSQAQAGKTLQRMLQAAGLPSRGARPDKESLGYYLGVLSANHETHRKSLSEGGFLSNPEDAQEVDTPEGTERLSWGIYAGVCDMLGVPPVARWSETVEAFTDGFDGPLTDRWVGEPFARASAPSRSVVVLTSSGLPADLRTGGSCWRDYTVSAKVRPGAGAAPYSLLARCSAYDQGRHAGYALVLDETARKATLLASADTTAASLTLAQLDLAPLVADAWRTLSLDCRGDVVTASIDGAVLRPVDVPAPLRAELAVTLARGSIGLVLQAGTGQSSLSVDEVSVAPARRQRP